MNARPDLNASHDFFTTLATFHQQQATGTILGLTLAGKSIVVQWVDGEITGLRCDQQVGAAAIAHLELVDIQQFMVVGGPAGAIQTDLPATAAILLALSLRIPLDLLAGALQSTAESSMNVFVQAGW
jgi:hypothetical protein